MVDRGTLGIIGLGMPQRNKQDYTHDYRTKFPKAKTAFLSIDQWAELR